MSGSIGAHANRPPSDNAFVRWVGRVSAVCGWIAALMLLAAVFITCQAIALRLMKVSTVWQNDVVKYLMIAATMIGLPYVQRLRGHVNVDLIPLLLPPPARRALAYLVLLATMAVVAGFAWYAFAEWRFVFDKGYKLGDAFQVAEWIPRLAVPLGLALFFLQLAADLVALWTREDRPFDLDDDERLMSEVVKTGGGAK